MDQRAGVWPVEEGGSSGSIGPAGPKDVEDSDFVNRLWLRQLQQQQTEKSTRPVGMQCSELGVAVAASDVAECISIVQEVERDHDSGDFH